MSQAKDNRIEQAFHVPLFLHLFSGFVHRWPRLWIRLGNLESWLLSTRLEGVKIDRPVYVAGLARSGSTILLEFLASHPDVVTHQYRDYPPIFTPYWWQQILQRAPKCAMHPVERTHLDGLMVTSTSPEAMEEVVWLAFFPETHNPEVSQLLNGNTNNSNFETFYISHIKKLLLSRAAQRYVSKGNYNLTRLPYLLKLFPSARFIIPVRRPLTHVASLMKQQRLFATGEGKHPRALEHMRRLGHFEFGLDRRAINVGDSKVAREVRELWQRGEEPRGWARYWASIYGWLADRLDHDQLLREAAAVVRFEDLCNRPQETLSRVLVHTGLANPDLVSEFANRVQAPTYYRPSFSAEEASVILQETGRVAERYGYIGSEIAVPSGPVG